MPEVKRAKFRGSVSKSNAITGILVGSFVVVVVFALVLTYIMTPSEQGPTSTASGLYFSGLVLISGSASSNSLNRTCTGDAQLEIYVTSYSPDVIYMTNVTISASRLSANATTLVPVSKGCLPISESYPGIAGFSNDLLIMTYPEISVPPYTSWNISIDFSNGQRLSQPNLVSQPT